MRTTVDHFTAAEEVGLDQARGLARTIADTLAAYPSPACLVMHHDDDVLWQPRAPPTRAIQDPARQEMSNRRDEAGRRRRGQRREGIGGIPRTRVFQSLAVVQIRTR